MASLATEEYSDDDEHSPLLKGHHSSNTSIQNKVIENASEAEINNIPDFDKRRQKIGFFLLNVITILVMCSSSFKTPLIDQYLYKYFAEPLMGANASKNTASNPCFDTNKTSNGTSPEEQVQQVTANFTLWLDMPKYMLRIIWCLVIGLVAPIVSRGAIVVVPLLGTLFEYTVIFLVVLIPLDVKWLYLGYDVDGLSGSVYGLFFVTNLYASEITSRGKSRTLTLTLLVCARKAAEATADVVSGQLIQHDGFTIPAIIAGGLLGLAIMLGVVFAFVDPPRPQSVQYSDSTDTTKQTTMMRFFSKLKAPFVVKQVKGMRTLVIVAIILLVISGVQDSMIKKVRSLYFRNQPFCWSAGHIGWFQFTQDIANYATTALILWFFARYASGGVTLTFPATLLGIGSCCLYAFASDDLHLYLAAALGITGTITSSLLRGETSRALGPEAQGPWFAVISLVNNVSVALGTPILAVYKASVSHFDGLVFIIAGGLLFFQFFILIVYHVKWRRYISMEQTDFITDPCKSPCKEESIR